MTRFLATILGCAFVLATTPLRADDSAAADERQLLAATQAVLDAQIHFDQQALDALLAPGYIEISPIGDVDERGEVLGFYAPQAKAQMLARGVQPLSAKIDDARVRVFDDHAIVTALDTATMKINDATQQRPLRGLFHFRRIDDHWRLQTAQYTAVKPATK